MDLQVELDRIRSTPYSGKTIKVISAFQKKLSNTGDLKLKADVYHFKARVYAEHLNNPGSAAKNYDMALNYRRRCGDRKGEAMTLNNIGNLYLFTGQITRSVTYLESALEIKKELGDYKSYTATCENLGVAYFRLADHKRALTYHYESLALGEQFKDKDCMATSYQNIGMVHLHQKDYGHALESFKKALSMRQNDDIKYKYLELLNNIGVVLYDLKQYALSKRYFNSAYKTSTQINYLNGILYGLNNLGNVCIEQKKHTEALNYYKTFFNKTKTPDDIFISALEGLSRIYIHFKNYDLAEDKLIAALKASRKIKSEKLQMPLHLHLSRIYQQQGALKKALLHLNQYTVLNAKILNAENTDIINKYKNIYAINNKEKELKEAQLRQTESELKALRAQMDPHFIFNSLAAMRNELLTGNIDKADEFLVRFSRLVRLTLDNSRTSLTTLKNNIELVELYIQLEQARQARNFEYKISYGKNIDPERITISGHILQPIVENAIIHGLFHKTSGKGRLLISFTESGNVLQLRVNDNGVGSVKSTALKPAAHQSHAINIVKETLALLWNGTDKTNTFTFRQKTSKNGKISGTEVIVLIPLQNTGQSI